jgi:hypothetical protein
MNHILSGDTLIKVAFRHSWIYRYDQYTRNVTELMSGEKKNVGAMLTCVALLLGSTYILISFCILLILPILQVAFGASFVGQCPINSNIPIYLIVSGVCGISSIMLILISVSRHLASHPSTDFNIFRVLRLHVALSVSQRMFPVSLAAYSRYL